MRRELNEQADGTPVEHQHEDHQVRRDADSNLYCAGCDQSVTVSPQAVGPFDVDIFSLDPLGEDGCTKQSRVGLGCTRTAGHPVPHIATAGHSEDGLRRIVAAWWGLGDREG